MCSPGPSNHADVDPLDPRFLEQLLDPRPISDLAVRGGSAAQELLSGSNSPHERGVFTAPVRVRHRPCCTQLLS